MSYANHVTPVDDQTITSAKINGAGRFAKDCILGIGSDGTGASGPLYLDGTTLKCYEFTALLNGLYGEIAADTDVSSIGESATDTYYILLCYASTSDAGVDDRATGSKSTYAFSLRASTTNSTPTGYDASVSLGTCDYTSGGGGWSNLSSNNLYFEINRGLTVDGIDIVDGEVDGRDVSVDGTKLDTVEENADVTDFTNVKSSLGAADSAVDFNSQNITGVGTVDGRDVSADWTTFNTVLRSHSYKEDGINVAVNNGSFSVVNNSGTGVLIPTNSGGGALVFATVTIYNDSGSDG